MAGHSQFKNIMHRKGRQDAKRSKIFSKLSREITTAAKLGAQDPEFNPRLRAAIAAAKAQNMPNDNIDRAVKRSQADDAANYEDVRYEGFGPGGISVIVEGLTDNRNRTAAEVRAAFQKHGGNLGESGSVAYMFDRVGYIEYPLEAGSAEAVFEAALEAGADDCESENESHLIYTSAESLHDVRAELEKSLGEPAKASLIWRPQNTITVEEQQATTLMKLFEVLEDNDDVQEIFANEDIDETILEKLSA